MQRRQWQILERMGDTSTSPVDERTLDRIVSSYEIVPQEDGRSDRRWAGVTVSSREWNAIRLEPGIYFLHRQKGPRVA